MNPLGGIYAASLTPLNEDLSVDHDRLHAHIRWLLENGCHGIVLLGTTGEANSFSIDERLEMLDRAAEAGLPLNRIIAGTGCCALTDTIRLTARAHTLGYGAVLLLPPFYYKGVTDDGIYDGISRLLNHVGAEDLKIVLYHFPRMATVSYSMSLISRLRTFYPDQILGIKDSSGDEKHLAQLSAEFPDFRVFCGSEKLLSLCMTSGGSGCISATANVTSRLCRTAFEALTTDADAAESLDLACQYRSALETAPFAPGLKYLMSRCTGNSGWNTVRPPLMALGPEQVMALDTTLTALPELPNFV